MSTLPNVFKKATRSKAKLKLTITGPSGSGKTYSALKLAQGIGGKIAVIDSENDSASLYAGQNGMPEFDTLNLSPPYTTQKYIDSINAAVSANYDTVIIDSGTHQWAGEGGILSEKEKLDQRPNSNSYTNWGKLTPLQEQFKNAILHAPINLVMTLRSKQDYALARDEKTGKNKVEKLGMAPIQRDGLEYEFTTVFDVDMTHNASVSKDRTGLFDGRYFKISDETGKELVKWLGGAGSVTNAGGGEKAVTSSPPAETNEAPKVEKIITKPKSISPDEFFTQGKLVGKKIDEVDNERLKEWKLEAEKHFLKVGIDPELSEVDLARTYRAVKIQLSYSNGAFASFNQSIIPTEEKDVS